MERTGELPPAVEPKKDFDASLAFEIIDKVTSEIYLPYRNVERSILFVEPNIHHQENDTEHSWHIETLVDAVYEFKNRLGLELPDNFDYYKAKAFAHAHDIVELLAGDVDATTRNVKSKQDKAAKEQKAAAGIELKHPYLRGLVRTWREYERKDTPEAHLVNDLDKLAGTWMIVLDGGTKWHVWDGFSTSRTSMCTEMRKKMTTEFGHKTFDEMEKYFDSNPNLFPLAEQDQGVLFDVEEAA